MSTTTTNPITYEEAAAAFFVALSAAERADYSAQRAARFASEVRRQHYMGTGGSGARHEWSRTIGRVQDLAAEATSLAWEAANIAAEAGEWLLDIDEGRCEPDDVACYLRDICAAGGRAEALAQRAELAAHETEGRAR